MSSGAPTKALPTAWSSGLKPERRGGALALPDFGSPLGWSGALALPGFDTRSLESGALALPALGPRAERGGFLTLPGLDLDLGALSYCGAAFDRL